MSQTTILAVDNAVMFLNSLKRYLANTPYGLHCVTSGQEALSFLKDNKVDLILMDAEMPEINGYELARRIKQQDIKAPIVFITANAEPEDIQKATESGAAGILAKPFQTSQLIAKIKEFV
jgi:CheY-like chemotaxis protein